jgi:hypothetical protein
MAMIVFKIEPSKAAALQTLTSDDTVSRQSIHTRDAQALGLGGNFLYMRITGSDAGVAQAKKIVMENKIGEVLNAQEAERVSKAIDAEEDAAAEGMGMIFGG